MEQEYSCSTNASVTATRAGYSLANLPSEYLTISSSLQLERVVWSNGFEGAGRRAYHFILQPLINNHQVLLLHPGLLLQLPSKEYGYLPVKITQCLNELKTYNIHTHPQASPAAFYKNKKKNTAALSVHRHRTDTFCFHVTQHTALAFHGSTQTPTARSASGTLYITLLI